MIWYVTSCWFAFCFLLTLVVQANNVILVPQVWRAACYLVWQASLIILFSLVIYLSWAVLLAPAVKLFTMGYSPF